MSEKRLREALEAILAVPVNGNSEADMMALALDYIESVATEALAGKLLPTIPTEFASWEVGERVWWSDPDGGTCSRWGIIEDVHDDTLSLKFEDDGEAEVPFDEVSYKPD